MEVMRVTRSWLVRHGACELDKFDRLFPKGSAGLTPENLKSAFDAGLSLGAFRDWAFPEACERMCERMEDEGGNRLFCCRDWCFCTEWHESLKGGRSSVTGAMLYRRLMKLVKEFGLPASLRKPC
jgi:hypothetical protein